MVDTKLSDVIRFFNTSMSLLATNKLAGTLGRLKESGFRLSGQLKIRGDIIVK